MAHLISEEDKRVILEINDKFHIARNIIYNTESNRSLTGNSLVQKVSQLAGVEELTVETVLKHMPKFMSFSKWCDQQNEYATAEAVIPYHIIKTIIEDYYINKNAAPTITSLMTEVGKQVENLSVDSLLREMEINGYIWKRLPKHKQYIVVEKSNQVKRKMDYLYMMKEYRESNRSFVYIFSIELEGLENNKLNALVALAPRINFAEWCVSENNKMPVENFIIDILEKVPKDVVFAIEPQTEDTEETTRDGISLPDKNSPKLKMKFWLDVNLIPYDPDAHRADLYDLIQISSAQLDKTCERYLKKLKARGIDVIVRPPEITSFDTLKSNIKHDYLPLLRIKKDLSENIARFAFWRKLERLCVEHETDAYEKGLKLEIIIDSIIQHKRDNVVEDSVFEQDIYDNEWPKKIIHQSSDPLSSVAALGTAQKPKPRKTLVSDQ